MEAVGANPTRRRASRQSRLSRILQAPQSRFQSAPPIIIGKPVVPFSSNITTVERASAPDETGTSGAIIRAMRNQETLHNHATYQDMKGLSLRTGAQA